MKGEGGWERKNIGISHILSMILTKPLDMTWVQCTAQSTAMFLPRRHARISVSSSVTAEPGGSTDQPVV